MRVLITDFLAESDFEREVLPGVEVDALLSLIGHPPTPADLVRFIGERPASVLITWYEMFFDSTTLAALSRAGVVGIVRAGGFLVRSGHDCIKIVQFTIISKLHYEFTEPTGVR